MKNFKDINIPYIPSGLSSSYLINAGTKESICLDCDLPAKKCRGLRCKRYKEELKKINKEKGNEISNL